MNPSSPLSERNFDFPYLWDPRPDQAALWQYLVNGGKRAVEVAHRRWGKDDVALRFASVAALARKGNYWHMLPEYSQARKSLWTAVNEDTGKRRIDEAFPGFIRARVREQEMMIELVNGSTWQLVGSDNYNSLVGSSPVGIVFSEWALANPQAWAYLSPIVERNGGWALFIYTPRGNNHGLRMLRTAGATDGWFGEVMGADRTSVFSLEQLASIRANLASVYGEEQGEALFQQEYFCSFEGAVYGAYYAKQLAQARCDGRIGSVPHAPSVEVDTWWDLGVDDSMSIWFVQVVGKEFRFIDYYESSGYGLEHYAKVLKEKPYVYGNHYMPHDADVREMSSGEIARSRREIAESLGIRPVVVVPRVRNIDTLIQVHIPAVRNLLAQSWFEEKKCSHGLSALEGYQAAYDEEKKKLANRPAHTWCSHASDAFRTGAVGYRPADEERSVESLLDSLDLSGRW
jgi:phage terminase large subunit